MEDTCAQSGLNTCERMFKSNYDGSGCTCAMSQPRRLQAMAAVVFLQCHGGFCFDCHFMFDKTLIVKEMTDICFICLDLHANGIHILFARVKYIFCTACTRACLQDLRKQTWITDAHYADPEHVCVLRSFI